MSPVKARLYWISREIGIDAIILTGRDAYLVILARACRMFAFGANSLILAIFFNEVKFSDSRIGLFMTLTLLGEVVLGTYVTLIADRVGRRNVLLGGSMMMALSGVIFALFENFWILLLAAVVGVISVTGSDFGPFRSIEESIISELTTTSTRADVFSWYVVTSTLSVSAGSEFSGRFLHFLQDSLGWSALDSYRATFWLYAVMAVFNAGLTLMMTKNCELPSQKNDIYLQLPQEEIGEDDEDNELNNINNPIRLSESAPLSKLGRLSSWFTCGGLSEMSSFTRSVMYKIWFLLSIDSLADGMSPISLTTYYMDVKFHPTKAGLGDVTSVSYFLGAVASVFAGTLSRHIGLVNTMVFTHVPSSAAVLFFPLPSSFGMAALLLMIRQGLNNMDQAPRSAFIAAVVRPEERTAVMGVTNTVRTIASMAGPSLAGLFAAKQHFWIAFVAAGICRLVYDFGLYAMFINLKIDPDENNSKFKAASDDHDQDQSDIETGVELDTFRGKEDRSYELAVGGAQEPRNLSNAASSVATTLDISRGSKQKRRNKSVQLTGHPHVVMPGRTML